MTDRRGGIVMRRHGRNFADLSRLNSLHDLPEWWSAPNLKSDIDAYLAIHTPGNLERSGCLCDIHTHRLLAISVLACAYDAVKMFDVEEGRRRNLDRIYF